MLVVTSSFHLPPQSALPPSKLPDPHQLEWCRFVGGVVILSLLRLLQCFRCSGVKPCVFWTQWHYCSSVTSNLSLLNNWILTHRDCAKFAILLWLEAFVYNWCVGFHSQTFATTSRPWIWAVLWKLCSSSCEIFCDVMLVGKPESWIPDRICKVSTTLWPLGRRFSALKVFTHQFMPSMTSSSLSLISSLLSKYEIMLSA